MRIDLLGDIDWESRVDKVLYELSSSNYKGLFEDRNYGNGLTSITVIFMCQSQNLGLKRRMRFIKKEKALFMDIMLDLDTMKKASQELRKGLILRALAEEIPAVLEKYSIPEFDKVGFVLDLRAWLNGVR